MDPYKQYLENFQIKYYIRNDGSTDFSNLYHLEDHNRGELGFHTLEKTNDMEFLSKRYLDEIELATNRYIQCDMKDVLYIQLPNDGIFIEFGIESKHIEL